MDKLNIQGQDDIYSVEVVPESLALVPALAQSCLPWTE
jgi:hypothetical protein